MQEAHGKPFPILGKSVPFGLSRALGVGIARERARSPGGPRSTCPAGLREEAASQTRLRVAPACSRYVAYGVDVGRMSLDFSGIAGMR